MAILSKTKRKPAYSKSPTPLTISFSNICGLRSNFSDVESFLCQNSPDILALCETNLNSDIPSGDFLVPGYLPLSRTFLVSMPVTIYPLLVKLILKINFTSNG